MERINNQDNFIYGPYTPTLEKHIDFLKIIPVEKIFSLQPKGHEIYNNIINKTEGEFELTFEMLNLKLRCMPERKSYLDKILSDVHRAFWSRAREYEGKLCLDGGTLGPYSLLAIYPAFTSLCGQDLISQKDFDLLYEPWGKAIADLQPYKHD